MGTEEHAALVRRFYEEVWNRGNVDVAADVFAEDYVRHDLRPTPAAPGPAGQAAIARDFRAAFPDLHMRVDLTLAEGDMVAARWTTEGTNTGAWAGRQPTGKRYKCQCSNGRGCLAALNVKVTVGRSRGIQTDLDPGLGGGSKDGECQERRGQNKR